MASGLVSLCNDNNIKILAYGVLAGGFLTDYWLGKPKPSEVSDRVWNSVYYYYFSFLIEV